MKTNFNQTAYRLFGYIAAGWMGCMASLLHHVATL